MSEAPSGGSSGLSSSQMLGLGSLGIGALGLGAILGEGESPLPSEFSQLTGTNVPWLESGAGTLFNQGQSFTTQGQSALNMAQQGALTPEQQAQLQVYQSGLQNTAAQEYASMDRNPNQDTSFISTQADIDTKVNAMAQQQIQSTIALGLGEIQSGQGFSNQALGYESAANQALIAAGNAQIQLDQQYNSSLTGAFSAIGSLAGAALKAAPGL